MSALFQIVEQPVFDGQSLAQGATIYFYQAGTSTPKMVYSDAALTTERGTSVSVDPNGFLPVIYMDTGSGLYKYRIEDSAGALIDEEDNYGGSQTVASASGVTAGDVTGLVGYTSASDRDQVFVAEYRPGSGVGGGTFYWSAGLSKTKHNGGTVISPTCLWDGTQSDLGKFLDKTNETDPSGLGCWVRRYDGVSSSASLSLLWFGAVADWNGSSGTDNSDSIDASIACAVQKGISEIAVPSGTLAYTRTPVLDTGVYRQALSLKGQGSTSVLYCIGSGADALQVSSTQVLKNSYLRDLRIRCKEGHGLTIPYGVTGFEMRNVDIDVEATNKSLIYSNNPTAGIYDSIFENGDWSLPVGSTAHGVNISVDGTKCNENDFRNLRVYRASSVQFFSIQNTNTTTYLANNKIRDINFEVCPGGGVVLTNAKNCQVTGLSFWDVTADGATEYVNHLVYFKNNSGYESVSNTIGNFSRNGDTLGTGIRDLFLEAGQDSFIYQGFTQNADGPSYDLNNKRGVIIGLYYNLLNAGNFQKLGLTTELSLDKQVISDSGSLSIASGAITVTGSRHDVDTEAAAATDDLVTINGGTDGMILKLRATDDTRTVVVKATGGNIRLSGGADFSLDRIYDNLTLMYDSGLGFWVEQSRNQYP